MMVKPFIFIGDPNGVRTRVTGVRGRRPRPLDDGAICKTPTFIFKKRRCVKRYFRIP